MLVIGFVGQKGGVGKTVLAQVTVNAALARHSENRVLLIEADKQGSSMAFYTRVIQNYPELADRFSCVWVNDESELTKAIENADAQNYDYVVIDTAGSHAELTKFVFAEADKVLIPFRPVLKEYESQLATVEVAHNVKTRLADNGYVGPSFRLVLNNWSHKQRLTVEQKQALATVQEDPNVADFYIPERNAFDTLDQGIILHLELEKPEVMANTILRKNKTEDLQLALQTLEHIEAMK